MALGLPVFDHRGNALTELAVRDEPSEAQLEGIPCPLALVVVEIDGEILFGRNRWREEWELPGGIIEPGETPRAAAARELAEETGIRDVSIEWAGAARFELTNPTRSEYAAIYVARLARTPTLIDNDELSEFRWLDPRCPKTRPVLWTCPSRIGCLATADNAHYVRK